MDDIDKIVGYANAFMREAFREIGPIRECNVSVLNIEKVEHIYGGGEDFGFMKYVVEFYKISNDQEHELQYVESKLSEKFGEHFECVGLL